MDHAMLITWKCPKCEAENEDDYAATSIPLCGGCEEDLHWDEILSGGLITSLNQALAMLRAFQKRGGGRTDERNRE